ncbi:hypothetical protein BGW39_000086 [Mortierella sp. 14UC]|nr:hypothetical protein BGW39_000086 [Mortierella sp. 14UC]
MMDSNNSSSNNNNRSKSPYIESGGSGAVKASPGMDYSSESASSSSAPVHPLSTSDSSSPSFSSRLLPQQQHHHHYQQQQHHHHRPQTPTTVSTPTFQHQQLVKIKSEHGVTTPHPHQQQQQQQMSAPDIVMTDEDDDETGGRDSEQPTPSPMLLNSENMDEDEDGENNNNGRGLHHPSGSGQEKTPLMVDTSSGAIHSHHANSNPRGGGGAHMSMASPNMTATPSTATLMTPDSGATNSSSRRPSLRTMTATLPRSALQEETIALFKQYRNLIPCAKCFSRNTIQRDGMSDGNLRFKCRPPVSMSLICNKSYSESKIRNMIAGVVYGHSLPESGAPTSTTSSENILALALPSNMTKSGSGSGRRASQKYAGSSMAPDLQQTHTFQDNQRQDHKGDEYQEHSRPQQQQGGGYEEGGDDCRPGNRRPSSAMPSHPRRSSLIGQESSMMDYEESTMMGPPSSHLQLPNTPPLDGEEPRTYRPHSAYGHRPLTPIGAPPSAPSTSSTSTSVSRQGAPKLHHSHSHPNIGQQRHQQYLDQQRHNQQQQQQQQQSRQVIRIEPAPAHHGHGSDFSRSEMAERRFSHPAALQRSPSKHLPVAPNNAALSPALTSSSSQSSPRYEAVQVPLSSAGPGGRYEETHAQASYYQRRMSQPHPSSQQRSYGQLPPPPPPASSSHRYDRRASEVEEYNYQHLRQYERLNASTMRGGHPLKSKISPKQYSSPRSSVQQSDSPLSAQQRDGPAPPSSSAAYVGKPGYPPSSSPLLNSNGQGLRTPQSEPMRFSHSMPSIEVPGSSAANSSSGGRHAYQTPRQQTPSSSVYYHQPSSRDDLEIRDAYAHDSPHGDLSPEDVDSRPYAKMRQGFRKPGLGQSIRRLGSSPNIYTAATPSSPTLFAKDLSSALPRNAIKLTCFPSAVTAEHNQASAGAAPAAVEDDLDMKMSQSSKVVIEITQPRSTLDRSSTLTEFDDVPRPLLLSASSSSAGPRRALRHAVSQPNLLVRNSSSVLERRRRSVSPPGRGGVNEGDEGFGSSKKRRADSLSRDEDVVVIATTPSSSSSVAEAAAAAVVAAAANAARQCNNSSAAGGGVQIIGHDYSKEEVVGLGVVMDEGQVNSTCNSPMIDALDVAKASSYVSLEDQKELGIDYSLFTRVETAAWRILIPPNVTASFRSEDFGLTLKPKAASLASPIAASNGCAEITPLVAPMAAISTREIEEEEEEKDMVESTEDEETAVEKEGKDDQAMDLVMETEEEEQLTTTTTTTTTVTTTTMMTEASAATSAMDARGEEMMEDQLDDD